MNKIILTLPDDKIVTGKQISFVAPCGSLDTECLTIRSVDYTVCNASGANVAGTNAWASGAIVSVILNVEDHRAYVQNASLTASLTIGSVTYNGTEAVDMTDAVFNAVMDRLATWDGGNY